MNPRLLSLSMAAALFASGCAHVGGTDTSTTSASLENTHWQLIQLGENTQLTYEKGREPDLLLDSEEQRAAGSGGCNRFMGSYTLDNASIGFGHMAATQMACAKGMDTERDYFQALLETKNWQVDGNQLELRDDNDKLLARFAVKSAD